MVDRMLRGFAHAVWAGAGVLVGIMALTVSSWLFQHGSAGVALFPLLIAICPAAFLLALGFDPVNLGIGIAGAVAVSGFLLLTFLNQIPIQAELIVFAALSSVPVLCFTAIFRLATRRLSFSAQLMCAPLVLFVIGWATLHGLRWQDLPTLAAASLIGLAMVPIPELLLERMPALRVPERPLKVTFSIGQVFALVAVLGVAGADWETVTRARLHANVRACVANQRTLLGAVEMYSLDKNIPMPDLVRRGPLAELVRTLPRDGYLGAVPQDPGQGPGSETHYVWDTKNEVTCTIHGKAPPLGGQR